MHLVKLDCDWDPIGYHMAPRVCLIPKTLNSKPGLHRTFRRGQNPLAIKCIFNEHKKPTG